MKILKLILKTLLIGIGVVTLIAGVGIYWAGFRENTEAEAVAEKWFPDIFSQWDVTKFSAHLSPSAAIVTLDNAGKENIYSAVGKDPALLKQVFDAAKSGFGDMKSLEGMKCTGSLGIMCASNISFEHGNALVQLTLMKNKDGSGKYEILGLSILDTKVLKSGK